MKKPERRDCWCPGEQKCLLRQSAINISRHVLLVNKFRQTRGELTSENLSATMYRTLQDLSSAAWRSVGITRVSRSSWGSRVAMLTQASTASSRTESYWYRYRHKFSWSFRSQRVQKTTLSSYLLIRGQSSKEGNYVTFYIIQLQNFSKLPQFRCCCPADHGCVIWAQCAKMPTKKSYFFNLNCRLINMPKIYKIINQTVEKIDRSFM